MKSVRYTKYVGDLASEMDLESLLQALSEYLLDSGFRDPYARFQQLEHNLEDLREALRRILEEKDFFDADTQRQLKQHMKFCTKGASRRQLPFVSDSDICRRSSSTIRSLKRRWRNSSRHALRSRIWGRHCGIMLSR